MTPDDGAKQLGWLVALAVGATGDEFGDANPVASALLHPVTVCRTV